MHQEGRDSEKGDRAEMLSGEILSFGVSGSWLSVLLIESMRFSLTGC